MYLKGLTIRSTLFLLAGVGMASLFAACGVDYHWGGDIDPYAQCLDPTWEPYHSLGCTLRRCFLDAGIPEDNCNDAGSSEEAGSSARCSGTCITNAPNGFGPPQPVYIGQGKAKYALGCPAEIGGPGGLQYTGLNIPSPGCSACVCGPLEGSCAPPTTITLRASTCDVQPDDTFDFSPPSGWDGSCTNFNAMPAGAECPLGSGVSCAQSIDATELAPPVEGCAVIPLPVPKLTSDSPWWSNVVLSCTSNVLPGACDNPASESCLPSVPPDEPEWRYCAGKIGIHKCPDIPGAVFVDRFVSYDGFIDTRKCTDCECVGAGGSCFGTLRAYADDTCSTNEIISHIVFSDMPNCSNLPPSGDSFGSKEFTDLTYVPGTCEAKGGEPIGDVTPIETAIAPDGTIDETVMTWCCLLKNPAPSQ